jgi:predicted Kef-type K+ transport protein
LPPEGLSLVVAGALLSITLNPLAFRVVERCAPVDRPDPAPHATPAAELVPGGSQLTQAAGPGKL